jgi:hypothetical protein
VLQAVAVVQRSMRGEAPAAVMRSLGFGPLLLLRNFAVSMSGKGQQCCGPVWWPVVQAASCLCTFYRCWLQGVALSAHSTPSLPSSVRELRCTAGLLACILAI